MKIIKWFALAALAFAALFLAAPAFGAEVVGPVDNNPNVVINAAQKHKDLYTAGGNLTIDSDIAGDLTAAGGMVNLGGKVEKEAIVAGGNLYISGQIGSHARLAGGNITVSSSIGGDLVVAGGNVNLTPTASVGGDLLVAGGNVSVNGPISGNIKLVGGTATINSKVSGNIDAKLSKQLFFGPSAEVTGKINYSAPTQAVVDHAAKLGEINFNKITVVGYGRSLAGLLTVAFLIKLLAWLIAALLLVKFRKSWTLELVEEFKSKPWQNLAYGVLALIATPVLAVALLFTVVGYYLAGLLALVYVFTLIVSNLLGAVVLGYVLLGKMNKPAETAVDWQAVLIGVVVWLLLALIPVLGWLAILVMFLMVFGALAKKMASVFSNN